MRCSLFELKPYESQRTGKIHVFFGFCKHSVNAKTKIKISKILRLCNNSTFYINLDFKHHVDIVGVAGSIPARSTILKSCHAEQKAGNLAGVILLAGLPKKASLPLFLSRPKRL